MPADPKTPPAKDDADRRELGSPYGPQPDGEDEAAGGADSSPLENVPSGERKEAAEEKKAKG
jgi:hypothetical protein